MADERKTKSRLTFLLSQRATVWPRSQRKTGLLASVLLGDIKRRHHPNVKKSITNQCQILISFCFQGALVKCGPADHRRVKCGPHPWRDTDYDEDFAVVLLSAWISITDIRHALSFLAFSNYVKTNSVYTVCHYYLQFMAEIQCTALSAPIQNSSRRVMKSYK